MYMLYNHWVIVRWQQKGPCIAHNTPTVEILYSQLFQFDAYMSVNVNLYISLYFQH